MNQQQINHLQQWFQQYLEAFQSAPGQWLPLVKLKIDHSLRVAAEARAITAELGGDTGAQCLSEAAGLLHDIGRFDQFRRYATFSDARSVNHGECGYTFLCDHDLLADLTSSEREAILLAVRLHNRRQLPADLSPTLQPLAALIRDVDKLDIFYVVSNAISSGEIHRHPEILLDVPWDAPLSSEVIAAVAAGQPVPYTLLHSMSDFRFAQLGWVYDIKHTPVLQRLVARGYLAELQDLFASCAPAQAVLAAVAQYVAKRLDSAAAAHPPTATEQ